MNAKHRKWALAALLLGTALPAGVFYGWHWYAAGRYLESTDDAYVKADVVAIRPEVQGRLIRVRVHENQAVHAGQILVVIDPTDFRARDKQAQAQLAENKAAAAEAREQIKLQEKKVDEAQADVAAAAAKVRRAGLELKRARALARQSYASRQRLETTEAGDKVAGAKLSQAQAALAAEQQRRTVLLSKLDSARATISSARANAEFAASQLAKTRIVAPCDGIVGDLGARVGAMAQPSMTLLRVVPIPHVYVTANYKETQIGHMSIGQPVSIHVDAFPDTQFQGVVASLAPATGTEFSLLPQDNATGNFNKIVQRVPVRIRVIGPTDQLARLRPGLSVVTGINTKHFNPRLSYLDDAAPDGDKLAAR